MTLLDYFHIVHVYIDVAWWEDSWDQEAPLYMFRNVARIYEK